MKTMDKRGVEPIIATTLLVLLALVGGGVVAYYTIPLVSNVDSSCLNALKSVEFSDVGFTCTLDDPSLSSFSIRISDPSLAGFDLGFRNDGNADTVAVKNGATYQSVCQLDSVFGQPLSLPESGGVRTYITQGKPAQIFISPILASGKSCYSEGRKELQIEANCVDPSVKTRMAKCLNAIATGPYCGDGTVNQANETCDPPTSCNAPYGGTCSYCDTNCQPATLVGPSCGDFICNGNETSVSCPSDNCAVPACNFTSANWSVTNAVEGTSVSLIVNGTNCDGQTLNWTIWEDDIVLFGDQLVSPSPADSIFSNGQATTTWTALWQDDVSGDPEYYFVAQQVNGQASITSSTATADELTVTQAPPQQVCGNSVKEGSETCDDGNVDDGDGCSSACSTENGWTCTGIGSGSCSPICGDSFLHGNEQCDPPQAACTPPYNGNCQYCGSSCVFVTLQGPYCGDGVVQSSNGEQCDPPGQTQTCTGGSSGSGGDDSNSTGTEGGVGGSSSSITGSATGSGSGSGSGTRTCTSSCTWSACA